MGEFQAGDKVSWNKTASDIAWVIGLNANMSYAELEGLVGTVTEVIYDEIDGQIYGVSWVNQHTDFEWECGVNELTLVSRPTIGKDRYARPLFDLED